MPLIPLTITATSGDKTYGDTKTFAGTEFSTSGLAAGDSVGSVSLSSSGAAATAQIGEYAITPSSAVGVGLDKYEITYVDGSLTVVKAQLTIKVLDRTKEYGSLGGRPLLQSREYVVSGLVNDDAVRRARSACEGYEPSAPVSGSPYEISVFDAEGTGLDNYEITYETGLLHVTRAPLSVIPRDVTKNFRLTYVFGSDDVSHSGFAVDSDGFSQIVLFSEGAAAEAEPNRYYPIYVQLVDGIGLDNYEITFGTGKMFVTDGRYGGTPMCGKSGRPVDGLNAPVCATELHYLSFALIHHGVYGGSVRIELYRDPPDLWWDSLQDGSTIKLDIPDDMAEFAVGDGYRFLIFVRLIESAGAQGASASDVKVRATLRSSVSEFTVEKSIYINEHPGEPSSFPEYLGYVTVNSTFTGLTYNEAFPS